MLLHRALCSYLTWILKVSCLLYHVEVAAELLKLCKLREPKVTYWIWKWHFLAYHHIKVLEGDNSDYPT